MRLDLPGSVSLERLQTPFESGPGRPRTFRRAASLQSRRRSLRSSRAFPRRLRRYVARGRIRPDRGASSHSTAPLTTAWTSARCPRALTDAGDRAYKSLMADWGSQRKGAASALFGALICLVALQGIIFSARTAAAFRFHASASVAAANYEICRIGSESDRGAPIDERHTTDQCCLLCGAGGRGDPPTLLSFLAVVGDFFTRPASTGVPLAAVDDFDRSLEPWANSHLARAPPSLS